MLAYQVAETNKRILKQLRRILLFIVLWSLAQLGVSIYQILLFSRKENADLKELFIPILTIVAMFSLAFFLAYSLLLFLLRYEKADGYSLVSRRHCVPLLLTQNAQFTLTCLTYTPSSTSFFFLSTQSLWFFLSGVTWCLVMWLLWKEHSGHIHHIKERKLRFRPLGPRYS